MLPARASLVAALAAAALGAGGCLSTSRWDGADLDGSELVVEPSNVPQAGTATVTVRCARRSGAPISGVTVALQAAPCPVQPALAPVDATGTATLQVGPCAVGPHTVRATLHREDLAAPLPGEASVTFYADVDGAVPAGTALTLALHVTVPVAYQGTLTVQSSDPLASLPATVRVDAAAHGTVSLPGAVVLRTPGTQTVDLVDAASGQLVARQSFDVAAGGNPQLVVVAPPGGVVAGLPLTLQVSVQDAPGHVAANFAGQIAVTSSDAAATLPAPLVWHAGDTLRPLGGLVLQTPGAQAVALSAPGALGASLTVQVTAAVAARLRLDGDATAVAGTPYAIRVAAVSAGGAPVPDYVGVVTLGSSDARAVLPTARSLGAADAGAAALAVTFAAAGTQAVLASDAAGLTAAALLVVVQPAAAAALALGAPPTAQAGSPLPLTVALQDAFGNAVPQGGSVQLQCNDPGASLPTQVSLDPSSGSAQVGGVVLERAGATEFDASLGAFAATALVSVRPAAPSQITVALQNPSPVGQAAPLTATVLDGYGNVVQGYSGTLHVATTDAAAQAPADAAVTASDAGVHAFAAGITFATSGAQTVTVSDATGLSGSAALTVHAPVQLSGHLGSTFCARFDDGVVKCWGANGSGQLGVGDTQPRGTAPQQMGAALAAVPLGSGRSAVDITVGDTYACAVLDNGGLKCWGSNSLGQADGVTRGITPGQLGDNLPPVALGAGRSARRVSGQLGSACAALDDGSVLCFGAGSPGGPTSMGSGAQAVALSGFRHSNCALLVGGVLKCWGSNGGGVLGTGDGSDRGDGSGSADNLGTGRTAVRLFDGWESNFVLLDNGTLKAWGTNNGGSLGYGDTTWRGGSAGQMGDNLPAISLGTGRTARAAASNSVNSCAVLDNGQLKCWGNPVGSGANQMGNNLAPLNIGTGRRAVDVAMNQTATCVLLDNHQVRCMGGNNFGELGQGSHTPGTGLGDSVPYVRW